MDQNKLKLLKKLLKSKKHFSIPMSLISYNGNNYLKYNNLIIFKNIKKN